jgi:hypothetical protein
VFKISAVVSAWGVAGRQFWSHSTEAVGRDRSAKTARAKTKASGYNANSKVR